MFPNKKYYNTPREVFESESPYSMNDYSYDIPTRKYITMNEIAVLPMDDFMVLYIGYVQDSKNSEDVEVLFFPMKIVDGYYRELPFQSFVEAENFVNDESAEVGTSFFTLSYHILPANSPRIKKYDADVYKFYNTKFIDYKGKEREVVFCYTYEINWEIGDGSRYDEW